MIIRRFWTLIGLMPIREHNELSESFSDSNNYILRQLDLESRASRKAESEAADVRRQLKENNLAFAATRDDLEGRLEAAVANGDTWKTEAVRNGQLLTLARLAAELATAAGKELLAENEQLKGVEARREILIADLRQQLDTQREQIDLLSTGDGAQRQDAIRWRRVMTILDSRNDYAQQLREALAQAGIPTNG